MNPRPFVRINLSSFFSSSDELLKFFISLAILKEPLMGSVLVILSYSFMAILVLIFSKLMTFYSSLFFFCSGVSLYFSSIFLRFACRSFSCISMISSLTLFSVLKQKWDWLYTGSILPLRSDIYLMSLYFSSNSTFFSSGFSLAFSCLSIN